MEFLFSDSLLIVKQYIICQTILIRMEYLIIQSQVSMNFVKEQHSSHLKSFQAKASQQSSGSAKPSLQGSQGVRQLLFEKNYPKNIFIPLIQHLSEIGLKQLYEQLVGTRQSFQGKNVVSLAEIHRVISQPTFRLEINLPMLLSNMSNKILMNSKIKKKLFHLLLIKQIFIIPTKDGREFKKLVSKKANQVCQLHVKDDHLFTFPSAIIYLLHLFVCCLEKKEEQLHESSEIHVANEEETKKYCHNQENGQENKLKTKEISSKEEYKMYINKIISVFNSYPNNSEELFDTLQTVRQTIKLREKEISQKYNLPQHVPEWSHFNTAVVNNCYQAKRDKTKLTYCNINQWIQEFKQTITTCEGFRNLRLMEENVVNFKPILIIKPPTY